ncbi:copper-binding transcription factor [Arachnomyces sp. PD_36]|nr:copper-binding transcription factor [Arachnomyces sp. PD_36]
MSTPHTHPRRKALKGTLPPLSTSPHSGSEDHPHHHGLSLRKGETFQVSTPPSSENVDPILNIPSLPRRSLTSPKSLEDVIAAGEQRMAGLLSDFERNLSGLGSSAAASKAYLRGEDLPVPKSILAAQVPETNPTNADTSDELKKASRHQHTSDSGLGTSISGSSVMGDNAQKRMSQDDVSALHLANVFKDAQRGSAAGLTGSAKAPSTITRSASFKTPANTNQQGLELAACKQIERFILVPILREKRLESFHPLIKGIPERIVNKEITCLRDLEKTLIFLAPVSKVLGLEVGDCAHQLFNSLKKHCSAKASSYLNFCEFSIQCIHTTVGYLNEREQRRPADRPYTNGYFLDLVEQIRQYANMMAASRQRESGRRGSAGSDEAFEAYVHTELFEEESSYSPCSSEELSLEGGLGSTGRPAELVRVKDGKKISLRTGAPYEESSMQPPMMKRSLSTDSTDDSVMRSMARRKKDAPPLNINKKCDHCDRVFKRPCDLTKHEKTHSRPWKCTDPSCKYAKLGWPTEKERDRHENDKHSKAPPLFRCLFDNCTYQSKRESNCKQHMEKAHGWTYVRSKNTGKNSKKGSAQPTPQTPNIDTPISNPTNLSTPGSAMAPSPSPYQYQGTFGDPSVNPYAESSAGPSAGPSGDFQLYPEPPLFENNQAPAFGGFSPFPSMDFNAFQASLQASDPNEYVPSLDMRHPSIDSSNGTLQDQMPSSGLEDALAPTSTNADYGFDWGDLDKELDNGFFDNDYTALNMQQLMTPASSVNAQALNSFSRDPSLSGLSPLAQRQKISSLSPGGQGNLMLYSPNSTHLDEGFHDSYEHTEKQSQDFTLFERSARRTSDNLASMSGGRFDNADPSLNQMFPPMPNYQGGQYDDPAWSEAAGNMDMDMNMEVDDYMHMDEL